MDMRPVVSWQDFANTVTGDYVVEDNPVRVIDVFIDEQT
jgi:hypothetical protein